MPEKALPPAFDAFEQRAERAAPPTSTYRLQFHANFTFRDAAALAAHLADLGVSHVYASPIFKAGSAQSHGYDIADFNQLNPHLGGRDEYEKLVQQLRRSGLGIIVDWVPNHMGIDSAENDWWMEALEFG